jgi:hypothetical protein
VIWIGSCEVLEREALRVPVAVLGLGEVLPEHRVVRDVAVVADRVRVVRPLAQPSYCSFMMWQLMHAAGSSER